MTIETEKIEKSLMRNILKVYKGSGINDKRNRKDCRGNTTEREKFVGMV